jgi:nitrite reductase (NADH) small subunit
VSAETFIRLFPVSQLPPGGGIPVEVEGRQVAVFNAAGVFYAVDNECPHKGGPLAEGVLTKTVVTCPLHRWQFDVRDGRNPVNPALCVRQYPVEIRGGDVWIDPN